jgi:hypothetical protein
MTWPFRLRVFLLAAGAVAGARCVCPSAIDGELARPQDQAEQTADQAVQPYMNEPTKTLEHLIPELRGMRPAADQQELEMILKNTSEKVDEFFRNAVDLVANEEIKQERLNGFGGARREPVRDSYLIVRHENGPETDFDEFRTDENGNRLDSPGLQRGFLVTAGFALICIQFSTDYQQDTTYRYLGDEKVNGRETYVVGFAERPGEAIPKIAMTGPSGTVRFLTQGIAWIDKQSFHILRMRTDLLDPQPGIGLDAQTTKIGFSEVQLADVVTPLWLPRDVSVYLKIGRYAGHPFEEEFRNVHHYSDYRRYRVSTRIVSPQ